MVSKSASDGCEFRGSNSGTTSTPTLYREEERVSSIVQCMDKRREGLGGSSAEFQTSKLQRRPLVK